MEVALVTGFRDFLNTNGYDTTTCVGDSTIVYIQRRGTNRIAKVMVIADGYITIWHEIGDGEEGRCDLPLSDPQVFEKLLEVLNA